MKRTPSSYHQNAVTVSRKHFISIVAKTITAAALIPPVLVKDPIQKSAIKAIAFDAFTLFDTRSVLSVAAELFAGKENELMMLWHNRQFEYTWLRSVSKTYQDFWKVTGDALVFAAASLKLDLTAEKKSRLMQALLDMKFLSEAGPTLQRLKQMNIKLAILSNATPTMLQSVIVNSGLQQAFDFVISTDKLKTYKPDPAAYRLGVDALKLKKAEILFVAFGGWDAAGAKAFGYPTVWINGAGAPPEQLDHQPDFICTSLTAIYDYVKSLPI